jgi:hypothetical protein
MSYKSIIPAGILQCHIDNHCIIYTLFYLETIVNKETQKININ